VDAVSYARFGCDGSNVYVIPTRFGLQCCGCVLQQASFTTVRIETFAEHLDAHRAVGDIVPDSVMLGIRNDEEWLKSKGVVQ